MSSIALLGDELADRLIFCTIRVMSRPQLLLPEFDQEMAGTRRVLERVPDDRLDWRLHPKSNTIGWLATHLATIPTWTPLTFDRDELDVNPPGEPPYREAILANRDEIVVRFDQNVASARASLEAASDASWDQPWTLLSGGQTVFTMPRGAVIRSFVLNHIIHHRAILTVNLRLNDIPVPGLYGPSGDE